MQVIIGSKRHDTSKMEQLVNKDPQYSTGVTLLGIWKTQKGQVLVVTDSVWASGRDDGTTVGVKGHFASTDEIAQLATRYGGELWDMVPEGD